MDVTSLWYSDTANKIKRYKPVSSIGPLNLHYRLSCFVTNSSLNVRGREKHLLFYNAFYHWHANTCKYISYYLLIYLTFIWCRIFLEKLIITQLLWYFLALYGTEGSLPCSESVLKSTPMSLKYFLPFMFSYSNLCAFIVFPVLTKYPISLILFDSINIWETTQIMKLRIM